MQENVQKLTRTTFPRSEPVVSGCELSHSVAPAMEGMAPSTGNRISKDAFLDSAFAHPVIPICVKKLVMMTPPSRHLEAELMNMGICPPQITTRYQSPIDMLPHILCGTGGQLSDDSKP